MEFRIADTFTDSLARLRGDEQKAVKTTAFDLQMNPAQPGLQFHRLDKAKDPRFWSVRVNADIRLIVHRATGQGAESSLLLCYVAHHDDAYQWAERRKLETHPRTGAAQLVEVRETVVEIAVPRYVEELRAKPRLFGKLTDEELLGYGVPTEWLEDARAATEDTLLELADHLPKEAAEALLDLATGSKPKPAVVAAAGASPFEHPDAMRRFRVLTNVAELEQALDYPWEKWIVFLHPAQRQMVEREYGGPARVSGSAGTGKTIVALHRAVHLARKHPEARVLLTTFTDALANSLRAKLRRLIASEPRLGERIDVEAMDALGRRLYESHFGGRKAAGLAGPEVMREVLDEAMRGAGAGLKFPAAFLKSEWDQLVDAWQLDSWELYRDVARLGRKTRLSETQRKLLWGVFERMHQALAERKLVTHAGMFTRLSRRLEEQGKAPYEFAVVDESQDIRVSQLRFLAAMGAGAPNRLFFAGDLGQRIFQQPYSWKALGVDIRGRSTTLKINYRTSHQIRMQADRLLGPDVTDVDGNVETRKGTVSVFNGPAPEVKRLASEEEEIAAVGGWLKGLEGMGPQEVGVFVRTEAQFGRAKAAVEAAGLKSQVLDEKAETRAGLVSIGTMHLAKGLEFRAVAVMACDDDVTPLKERIEQVAEESDLLEAYSTERHLLYVACTRARDRLLVTGVEPASEFLDDLEGEAL